MSNIHDGHDMECNTIGLFECINMLNKDQRRIFDQITDHLLYQRQHDCSECKYRELKLLHMFRWNWQIIFDRVNQKLSQRSLEGLCWQ